MTGTWLLRMAHWLRHPPSPARVRLVLVVLALCLVLYAVERWIGWPDALSTNRVRPFPRMSP